MDANIMVVSEQGSPEGERITGYLKRKGAAVFPAHTVNDVYRILRANPVNIVVADYNIPKINNLAMLKRIREIKPYVEVIFLSGRITLSHAIEAMKQGAYDFYESPVNMRLLMTVIGKALEKQSLHFEKIELERKVKEKFNFGHIIGRSKAMQNVIRIVNSVAPKNVNILLTGETGSGKEMIAHAIHYNSPRSSKPFIGVNCAAYNIGVLESELFGHEKGSFTGAVAQRVGRFELADGGTIFLDEIGDIPLTTQIKLLRVLQERSFERVGSNETIRVDVRVIAATHRNLKAMIEEGSFREDLYYRLNVVHIELPPLHERTDDIPLLVSFFMNKFNDEKGYHIKAITREAMQILLNYRWPGNVRELENTLEAAMALSEKNAIEAKYLPSFLLLSRPQDSDFYQIPQNLTLQEMEQEIIRRTLEKTGGNKSQAARLLAIGLRTLQRKTKEMA